MEIDEALLAEAAAELGAKTPAETVTAALHRVVADARVRRGALQQLADEGGFD